MSHPHVLIYFALFFSSLLCFLLLLWAFGEQQQHVAMKHTLLLFFIPASTDDVAIPSNDVSQGFPPLFSELFSSFTSSLGSLS